MKSLWITRRVGYLAPWALGVLAVSGCRTAPAKLEGRSSIEIIEPEGELAPGVPTKAEIEVEYVPGNPKGTLLKPIYPAEALAGRAGRYIVYADVAIDEAGRVSEVSRSVRGVTLPSPYSEAFFQAVRDAVAQWRFSPPRNVYWQRTPDGDRHYLRTEALATTMEVKFTFEASGVVK